MMISNEKYLIGSDCFDTARAQSCYLLFSSVTMLTSSGGSQKTARNIRRAAYIEDARPQLFTLQFVAGLCYYCRYAV